VSTRRRPERDIDVTGDEHAVPVSKAIVIRLELVWAG
jgi:hypothetical protein